MKEKIKRFFTKASYILFALCISFTLWMYVEITDNELHTRDILVRDIIQKNRELLSSRGLLVSSIITDNLTITFEGPRADISNLASDGVYIEVDLDRIRSAGTVALDYEIILPDSVKESNVSILGWSASQVVLNIDRLLSIPFLVEADYTGGTASDEFLAGQPDIDPQTITVSGPEEIVSQIAHIYVPIAAENLSTTYTDELSFILVDDNGEEIGVELRESGTLTFNQETIRVTVPVSQLKIVTLHVEPLHGITTTESNTKWFAEPSQITVSGDPEVVRDLNSITIGMIDMTSFGRTDTFKFPIILPNNLTNITGETEATVVVDVIGLATDIWSVSNLQTVNTPAGYSATIRTQNLDVRLRGTADNLAAVQPENILVIADLTDFGTGTSWANARATIVGVDAEVDIIGEYRIAVAITEENGELP